MKITHYLHDLSVFPLPMSFRPPADRIDYGQDRQLDPIVFVPGLGCHRNWFDTAFRHEALRTHALLSIDFPGQGDPTIDHMTRNYDRYPRKGGLIQIFAGCVQGALELVTDMNDECRVHVVAHSMGALPARIAWQSIPYQRRGRFISIEGNMTGDDCSLASRSMAQDVEAVKRFTAAALASDDAAMRRWGADLESCEPQFLANLASSIVGWCDVEHNHPHASDMKDTVYLYGERNGFPEHHRERFDEFGVIHQGIENSGHFPMHDNPDDLWNIVADAVRSYVARY